MFCFIFSRLANLLTKLGGVACKQLWIQFLFILSWETVHTLHFVKVIQPTLKAEIFHCVLFNSHYLHASFAQFRTFNELSIFLFFFLSIFYFCYFGDDVTCFFLFSIYRTVVCTLELASLYFIFSFFSFFCLVLKCDFKCQMLAFTYKIRTIDESKLTEITKSQNRLVWFGVVLIFFHFIFKNCLY